MRVFCKLADWSLILLSVLEPGLFGAPLRLEADPQKLTSYASLIRLLLQTELADLQIGDIMEGEVTCLMYFHGVQVDIGAQYDG